MTIVGLLLHMKAVHIISNKCTSFTNKWWGCTCMYRDVSVSFSVEDQNVHVIGN